MKLPSLNVLGQPLEACSTDPVTGFFRGGPGGLGHQPDAV